MSFDSGTRVKTSSGNGKVVFCGPTKFAEGDWVGVILDNPTGKNNGTVQGVEYFKCEPNYGVFVKASAVELEDAVKRSGLKAPAASAIRKDSSVMSRSAGSKASPGSSPGISPAASSEKLTGRQSGMGPRSMSKLVDPSESKMVREFSNLSQSSVASSRASASASKPRPQFTAPDAASRRQSLAPPKKVSTTAGAVPAPKVSAISKPRQSLAPTKPAEETPQKPSVSEAVVPNELPPPSMTESGTELPTESVLSRAKKIDDTGPAAPMSPISTTSAAAHPRTTSVSSSVVDHSTELEYLRLQVKELTDKLETTRAKRKEDHTKLLEYERVSIEHRTLQEVKGRLNDRVVELEKQLIEERRATEELKAWHENNKDTIAEHQEVMEMATIEKELAEEKADALQNEVTTLTEQLEEMKTELELLREEMAGGGVAPVGNTVQMKQIEMQNEKLKDALIKLRDLNYQANQERDKAVTEAERLKNENSELIRVAENLKRQAEIAESKIAGFQEQIDAAMGAEAMVTQLTDKNFNMEERITQLEETIEDMEEARDLDEQLAEVQKQQEKDLMKEIETLKIHIHELNGRIRDEQKHAVELSQTILKFRERMANLNSTIQDQKDQVLNLEEQLHGHISEDNDRASMFNQLQISANKNFAEVVERQINSIEVEFARRQAGYLKAFLPDNFARVGGENDSIQLVVMLPRFSAKAKLFANLASQCYPQVSGGMRREHVTKSHKGEQWAHVSRVSYLANSIIAAVGKLESAVGETTVETLIKLTENYGEMSTYERIVDQYLELLKTSRFDENTSLDNLVRPLDYFQTMFSIHIGNDGFNAAQWISATCASLTAGLAYCRINTQRMMYFLQESITAGEVYNLLQTLNDEFAACESVILKASRHLPSNGNDQQKIIKMDAEFTDDLLNAVSQLDKMASTLQEVCTNGALNFGGISETEGFDDKRVKEMIHSVVAKNSGYIAMENAFDPIRAMMRTMRDSLEKVNTTLESAKMEHPAPAKKAFPPLLDRAHHRKQAAQEAEGLRWQMEKKEAEMNDLRRQVKARIEDVSNYKLRLDMAESRLNSTDKAEGDKVKHLEEKINQIVADQRRKQIEFDESMDALQREMKEVEGENSELKQRAIKHNKEALWKNIHAMENRSAGAPAQVTVTADEGGASRGEVMFLENQLTKQTDARKRAELEIHKLKGELALSGSKRFSAVPGLISGPVTLESQTRQDLLLKLIDSLHDESLRLRRDEVNHQTYIPSNPSISTERMMEEMEKFNMNREQFYDKLNSVNRRLRRVWFDAWGEDYPFDIQSAARPVSTVPEPKKFEEISAKWGIVW